ncbi:MAG: thiamine-phosphate kinase [Planctomycetota bacterium]|nr:thiamine-phosphate kinase [Planctomycetota bacterium]MDA1140059.1 thiamine-phosphate kinase [Planctomycetota bacterium]
MSRSRQISEFSLIEWIRQTTPATSHPLGIGDDCAILQAPESGKYVITTDMVLEGVHFVKSTPPYKVGRKAAARSLSDLAAMGCSAAAVTACVVLPKGIEAREAKSLMRGIQSLLAKYDVPLVGGDVSSWEGGLVVNVTAVGDVGSRPPILRSGARPGDCLFVSGTLGGSILGRHLSFEPRLDLALELVGRFAIHSMIDISDGLAGDLGHIARESSVGAIIHSDNVPVSRAARRLSKTSGKPPLEHALFDGEDYELLFTAPRNLKKRILAASLSARVSCIGEITERTSESSPLLYLQTGRGVQPLPAGGFEHTLS